MMQFGGGEILPYGEQFASLFSQIAEQLQHLSARFPEAQHDAGFASDRAVQLFYPAQQLQ
jgi:hypothetical protein